MLNIIFVVVLKDPVSSRTKHAGKLCDKLDLINCGFFYDSKHVISTNFEPAESTLLLHVYTEMMHAHYIVYLSWML